MPRTVRRKSRTSANDDSPRPVELPPLPAFHYAFSQQRPRTYPGGSVKQATVADFAASKTLAGVLMTLKPGGLRELHWHANAAEWGYVISGNVRTTILDPQGRAEINQFGAGDIWFFPRGHGHSIQGLHPNGATFLLVFDDGSFSECATFSISDWLAQTPRELVATNLGLSVDDLKTLPTKEVYIALGPSPRTRLRALPTAASGPAALQDGSSGAEAAPLTHKYPLLSSPARERRGGKLWLATVREFPIATTMSGGVMELKPGGLRELHWHPNADEWQYLIAGRVRVTLFASSGMSQVYELEAGDVGFVPTGFGHAIENLGDTPCRLLLVFNRGEYEEIGLSTWLAANPQSLVETNLNLPPNIARRLPREEVFITQSAED